MNAKPTPRDFRAVEKLVRDAQAGTDLIQFKLRLAELTGHAFPDVAALLDLLAEHPRLAGDDALAGAVSAIQHTFVRLWDDCEALIPSATIFGRFSVAV